jgi:hypothetical protein
MNAVQVQESNLRILNVKAIEGPVEIGDNLGASATDEYKHEYDLFLSYRASADQELVTKLYDKIKAQQPELKVFLDVKELKEGEGWEYGFSKAVRNSRMIAIVISRGTFACEHGTTCKACRENIARLESEEYCDNVILGMNPPVNTSLILIVFQFDNIVITFLILTYYRV